MPNLKVDKARQLTNTWGPPKCPGCGLPTLVIREIVYSSYDVAAVVAGGLTVGGKPFVKEVRREVMCKNCALHVDQYVFNKEYVKNK